MFNLSSFLVENINQDTVGLEFRNLSDVMDHHADRNSDKNAVSYGDPERKSRARMSKWFGSEFFRLIVENVETVRPRI